MTETIVNKLKVKNIKTIARWLLAISGLAISCQLIREGSNLIIGSGVSEETLQAITGCMGVGIGLFLLIYFMLRIGSLSIGIVNKN